MSPSKPKNKTEEDREKGRDDERGEGDGERFRMPTRARRATAVKKPMVLDSDDDSDLESLDSYASYSSISGSKRKRGSSPTLADIKRRLLEEKERHRTEMEIADPSREPPQPSRSSKALPEEEDLRPEMRKAPAGDLGAYVLEYTKDIERIAGGSKTLNGQFVRRLRIATRHIRAAALEAVLRTESSAPMAELEQTNAELRDQVEALQARVAVMEGARAGKKPGSTAVTMDTSTVPQKDPQGRRTTPQPMEVDSQEDLVGKIETMMERRLQDFRKEFILSTAIASPAQTAPAEAHNVKGKAKVPVDKGGRQGLSAPPRREPVPESAGAKKVPTSSSAENTWAEVVGRKAKKAAAQTAAPGNTPTSKGKAKGAPRQSGRKAGKPKLARAPRTAAVAITLPPGSQRTYAEVMSTAKAKINLSEVGITELRPRRAKTGGLLLEIPGEDREAKAAALAARLRTALEGEGEIKVACPGKTAELRISGLDDSVTPAEIIATLADMGGCPAEAIKTGEIRFSSSSMGTIWVRCPLAAAKKVEAPGKIRVGWTTTQVEILKARPLQCHRCLEKGHVRARCTAAVDRSELCYNCGTAGHRAATCTAVPRCPLCADLGRAANHRLGSDKCSPHSKKGRKGADTAAENADAADTSAEGSEALPRA